MRWPWARVAVPIWPGSLVVRRSNAEIAGVVADPAGASNTRTPGIATKPVAAVACTEAG